jgi:hypothetical protein
MDMLLIITLLLLLLFGSGGYWARGRYYTGKPLGDAGVL